MKASKVLNVITAVLFAAGIGSSAQAQTTKQALFLGNSYTYFNSMPNTVAQIALSLGDSLIVDQNTPGGYTLQGHSTNATSITKINSRKWDYVILQDQSQRPAFPPAMVQTNVLPYAAALDSIIDANDTCIETMFYMTWGRKFGDQTNCPSFPHFCTYDSMQNPSKAIIYAHGTIKSCSGCANRYGVESLKSGKFCYQSLGRRQ